jgi:hypothetical protein
MRPSDDAWTVLEYEVKMFYASYKILFSRTYYTRLPYSLKNAIEEAAVLHTRNLSDVIIRCSSRFPDDILLSTLFNDWSSCSRYEALKAKRREFKHIYGDQNVRYTPCWIFNKLMVHSTIERGSEFDYRETLDRLYPHIKTMIAEIACLRKKAFPLRFNGPEYPPTLFWN